MPLRLELAQALLKHKGAPIPDTVLADFLQDCLAALDKATKARDAWLLAESGAADPAPASAAPEASHLPGAADDAPGLAAGPAPMTSETLLNPKQPLRGPDFYA